nr:unnamed protein product [Spirometra erinaceieuropaei]
MERAVDKPKVLFSYINSRLKNKEKVAVLKGENNEDIIENDAKAENLSRFFVSVFTDETDFDEAGSPAGTTDEVIENIDFTEEDVRKELLALKEGKSPGPDQIPAKVLKELSCELAKPLWHIFRSSFDRGILPSDWKVANIYPIHKGGSRTSTNNYRPMLAETADRILEYYQPPVTVDVDSRSTIAPAIEEVIKRLDALTLGVSQLRATRVYNPRSPAITRRPRSPTPNQPIDDDFYLTAQSPIISVNSAKDVFELKYQTEDKESATIALQSDFKFDHDLEMEIVLAGPTKLMIAYEEGDSKEKSGILGLDCLTVNFLPVFKEDTDTRNEVIFLIDRSGSMAGKNIRQAQDSLLLFLKSLPTDCRFQIIGFGSRFSALFDEPRDYTEDAMTMALEYQKNLTANMGGTEVLGALESIYAKKVTGSGWHRKIIFLTDGDITNQTQVISLVRRNAKTTRLFAIGLGDGASTSLVTGVARAGGGKSAFVRNEQRLQPVVLHILQLALQPFASEVELTWSITGGDGKEVMPVVTIPDQLPNLYSDSYATVIGLVDNPKKLKLAGTMTLKFEVNGQTYSNTANVAEAELPRQNASGDSGLVFHRQAAKIQILELSDRHASLVKTGKAEEEEEKEAERIQKKIVALSVSTNVISRFTAFVGVDPEKLDCADLTKMLEQIPRWTAKVPVQPMGIMHPMAQYSGYLFESASFGSAAPTMSCAGGFAASPMSYAGGFGMAPPPPPPSDCFAKSCSAVWQPGPVSPLIRKDEVPKDILVDIAELQNLNGFWNLESKLADLIGCQQDKLNSAKPQNGEYTVSVTITY